MSSLIHPTLRLSLQVSHILSSTNVLLGTPLNKIFLTPDPRVGLILLSLSVKLSLRNKDSQRNDVNISLHHCNTPQKKRQVKKREIHFPPYLSYLIFSIQTFCTHKVASFLPKVLQSKIYIYKKATRSTKFNINHCLLLACYKTICYVPST